MTWRDVTSGPFVDWGATQPLTRIDPYLVWAAATGFADYGGVPAGQVPALIELKAGHDGRDLQREGQGEVTVPPAYAMARVCSATIGAKFHERMRVHAPLGSIVSRVELALPVAAPRTFKVGETAPSAVAAPASGGAAAVLGVIDDGCAFAHASLRSWSGAGWRSRIAWLWDQRTDAPAFGSLGAVPADFGYGAEVAAATIEQCLNDATQGGLLDEAACYEAAGYRRLRRRATHGMHVLDIAAGPIAPSRRLDAQRRPAPTTTPDGAIVFVQLPPDALGDPTGGWLAGQVTDGIRYVLNRAPADAPRIVVNVSYGSRVGPHDGTSTLEAAILELLAEEPRLQVVLPAGNFFGDRAHAVLDLPAGEARSAECFVPPGSELPVFVEWWLPPGIDLDQVSVVVTPPGGAPPSPPVGVRQARVGPDGARPTCTVVFPEHPALGTVGGCILVVIEPTAHRDSARVPAPAGRWRMSLTSAMPAEVHGYVARGDADFGMPRRGGRPRFVADAAYDPQRFLRQAGDDPVGGLPGPPSSVRRRGTLAWGDTHAAPVGHPRLHVVGGYRHRTPWPAPTALQRHPPYASAGPARGANRPGPDLALPSDQGVVLHGVRAAGTRSGSTVRLVGTSSAAPQLARYLVAGSAVPAPSLPAGPAGQAEAFFGQGLVPPP
jgi:hypothetical protein